METGDLLRELIQFLEQAAPVVWTIARRQVIVIAIQQVVVTLLCGLGIALVCKQYWKVTNNESHYYDDGNPWKCMYVIVIIIAAILGVTMSLGAAGKFVNPDYYAIDLLLQYVK